MQNAVKYFTTPPLTGSLNKGNVNLGIAGNLGPTSTTTWNNGITPQSGKYIIYDVGSVAGVPLIYAPQSDAELIRLARSLGATGSNTGSAQSVLFWMQSQTNFMPVNKAYPEIITDGLVYLVDSTFVASYPLGGSQLSPLRDQGNVGDGTLQNGVNFNSAAGTLVFDGSDDQIPIFASSNFSNIDFSAGLTLMVIYKIDAVTDFNGQFRCMIGVTGANRSWNYYLYGASNPATTLQYHFSANYTSGVSNALTITTGSYHLGVITCNSVSSTFYHDGVAVGTQTPATPSYTTAGGLQYIGRGDNFWKGNIGVCGIYNKVLTAAEITQNYNAYQSTFNY